MSNRHLARTLAMQTMFLWDFAGKKDASLLLLAKGVFENFAPSFDDHGFVEGVLSGVMANIKEIDAYISKYATEWPLEQITIVDRNVLRIGVYELVYNDDIPAKVAINEAIEIAKIFGSESSGKFVNGVLGAIYKDMLADGYVEPERKVKNESEPVDKE
jgi:transcription antitermination protein NusB